MKRLITAFFLIVSASCLYSQKVCRENGRGQGDTWLKRAMNRINTKPLYLEQSSCSYETYVWNQTSYMLKYNVPWKNSNFYISQISWSTKIMNDHFALGFNYIYGNRHPYDYSLEYPRSFTMGAKYMNNFFDAGVYIGPVILPTDIVVGGVVIVHANINGWTGMLNVRVDDITTKRNRFLEAYSGYIESIHNAFARGRLGYQFSNNITIAGGLDLNTNHATRVSPFVGPELGYTIGYSSRGSKISCEVFLGAKTTYDAFHIDKEKNRKLFEQGFIDLALKIKYQNL